MKAYMRQALKVSAKTSILHHYGAYNSRIDPFKMEANKDPNMDYSEDMCPKTLDLLSRTVYVAIDPDRTEQEITDEIARLDR